MGIVMRDSEDYPTDISVLEAITLAGKLDEFTDPVVAA